MKSSEEDRTCYLESIQNQQVDLASHCLYACTITSHKTQRQGNKKQVLFRHVNTEKESILRRKVFSRNSGVRIWDSRVIKMKAGFKI